MANSKILFALLVLCLSVLSECGRFGGGRSSGRSSGGSSWGKSWGGSSSSGHSSWGSSYKPSSSWSSGSSSHSWSKPSYPSSSSGLSGSSWSKPSYPSSSSGLSGSSWSKPSYPSSSSGLSGFGSSWSKPSYPSSSSGLSGSGSSGSSWSRPSYPSSSSGLSGSGSGSHSYPSSSTGLSGSGSSSQNKPSTSWWSGSGSGSHSYPSSSTGLSGSGSGSRYPSTSGSGSHSYPSNTGLSGGSRHPSSGSSYGNQPHYNINTGRYDTPSYHHHTYYSAPQHVYVTQYRNSDSRYGDLLTGLTLYNMGRSHSHYHDHYYYDDYYRHRYNDNHYNTGSYNNGNNYQQSQSSYSKPQDEATCSLRITDNGKLEVLKIPCEIVSTFTEGSKKIETETHVNTKCTTNITVIPNPIPVDASNVTAVNVTKDSIIQLVGQNVTVNSTDSIVAELPEMLIPANTTLNATTISPVMTSTSAPIKTDVSTKNTSTITTSTNKTDNAFIQTTTTVTDKQTVVNITTCSNDTLYMYGDPLSVKGKLTAFDKMECLVDIRTKTAHFQNPVDCKSLMEYSKMPEPKPDKKPLLPPREKLKSWMEKPPWWLAMFIAV